ncbi:MAG: hypothetical protein EOO63_13040, partial [Hymenobacter sp.]
MPGPLPSQLKNWLPVVCLLAATAAQAQQVPRIYPEPAPTPLDSTHNAPDLTDKQQFAVPSVVGMGPSKGIILHYERTTPFRVDAAAQVSGVNDFNTRATKNARLIFKGYAPLLNHPHLKLILGLNYDREEFKFREPPTGYTLFDNIEDKGLKTIGAQLAIIYNRTFNNHWGVEALFPARVSVRYSTSDRSLFYGGYTVDGFNYIIRLRQELSLGPGKQSLSSLELRETEVKLRLRWERELLPFLWLGLEGGYRY